MGQGAIAHKEELLVFPWSLEKDDVYAGALTLYQKLVLQTFETLEEILKMVVNSIFSFYLGVFYPNTDNLNIWIKFDNCYMQMFSKFCHLVNS